MLSDLQLVYMVPRNSTQLLNINTTKFQVEREPVYPYIILLHPLQLIFSQSLLEGKLPQQWKDANVTPLHKKGPKSEVGNYRPVSLTSIPCQLLETLFRSRIVQYLEQNNLSSPSQHGFISKRSCLSNLLVALEAITKAIDEGNVVDMIYFDYQKAFDTVPHHRLKVRLNNNDSDFLILKLYWIVIHHWKGLENTVSKHFSFQF